MMGRSSPPKSTPDCTDLWGVRGLAGEAAASEVDLSEGRLRDAGRASRKSESASTDFRLGAIAGQASSARPGRPPSDAARFQFQLGDVFHRSLKRIKKPALGPGWDTVATYNSALWTYALVIKSAG